MAIQAINIIMQIEQILSSLNDIAPLNTAESWDNVGLLVGDRDQEVSTVMTCLTLTATTLREAIQMGAGLVVCHHPIPFKPLSKITSDTISGRLLLDAIKAGIAIYSPHTAWDNARGGINQQLAMMLRLEHIKPLQAFSNPRQLDESVGVGRYGSLSPTPIREIQERLGRQLPSLQWRCTHAPEHTVSKVGIVCGSGGSMLSLVASRGCDAMLTGEATYHQCLESQALGIAMIMIGHHASEFFAMARFAELLRSAIPTMTIVSSQLEMSEF